MSEARLRLRPDAYVAETTDGAVIRTHAGTVRLTGRSVHRWIERLTPHLDGRHTLAELTGQLQPERAEFVRALVTTLVERGVVREWSEEDEHPTTADRHRPEVDFVGYFRESPGRHVARYRDTAVLVLGAGRLAAALARALRLSGCRHVGTAPAPDETVVAGADVVIHVCDLATAVATGWLDELCERDRSTLCRVVPAGGEAWSAPAGAPPGGWRRLVAGGTPGEFHDPPAAVCTVVANQVVHDVFRFVTGLRSATEPALTVVDLDRLSTTTHRFTPHPLTAPVPGQDSAGFLRRIEELRAGPHLTPAEFSRGASRLMDARVGVFGAIGEQDLAQLPLHVTTATVSDPVGLLGAGLPRPVVQGAGPDFETARYRAAMAALATYASIMVDPRRLISAAGDPLSPPEQAVPADAATWSRPARQAAARAVDLSDGRVVAIPAGHVFPALSEVDGEYVAPVGVAAGYSWAEAVTSGLLAHCRRLTVAEAVAAGSPFPRVDPASGPGRDDVARCLALLDAIGEDFALHDVTGTLGVPTIACCLGADTVGYASATSHGDAVAGALQTVLLAYQARANGEPVYHPPSVPDLPPALRGRNPSGAAARATHDEASLVSALAAAGHRALAVPLDHDDEVFAVCPYLVRVVLDAGE